MLDFDDDAVREQYLLNRLGPDEREAVEQRLVADPDFFERLCAFEDELILRWLRGELSPDERQLFAKAYMSTPARRAHVDEMREMVAAAETLRTELRAGRADAPRARRGVLAWLTTPIALPRLAAVGVALLVLASVALVTQRAGVRDGGMEGLVLVATLTPSPQRSEGAGTPLVRVGVAADIWLRIELPSSVSGDSLEVEIRDVDRDAVAIVPSQAPEVAYAGPIAVATVKVSAADLPDADYVLTLFGRDESGGRVVVATRTFRVRRE